MAKLCPACSKANPATASYCYYDGRHLSLNGQEGPLHVGALPLPTPFYFPDGQSCANFNQLALACDARWDEARGLLADGTWQSFFGAIGRLDLATAAKQAVKEPDRDLGLSQLLEKFPTDPNTLRQPQLSLPSAEENLGALTPGTDRRFELLITNRGLLVLRGMATTNCEWLALGEGAGSALKMFQTRGIYTLPVRVLGDRIRAGRRQLRGEIVIDTNGGALTVPVYADVPVRPFPGGTQAKDVLAGARSPRDIALKAKANPLGAAVLFEQGAVKAWYASNGWTYPVQGTQASGKAAVQQFFEALGLSKPPRLENDTERLDCHGRVGRRLTKHLTISTKESRLVYAQAWSNQQWVKAGPGKTEGNKVTIPLHIEFPPRPGETVHADVTILGNGQQRFVVPVTLAVSAARPDVNAPEEGPAGRLPPGWIFAGLAGLLLVLVVGAVAFVMNHRTPPVPPTVPGANPEPMATAPKKSAWWDGIPNTNLAASASALKQIAPEDRPIFDGIAAEDETARGDAYEKLAAELPKLLRNPNAQDPLSQLLVDCCVFEPSARCARRPGQALTRQLPADGAAFQPDKKGEELERGLWSIQVIFAALKHPAMPSRPANVRNLTDALGDAFGPDLNEKAPPDELEAQTEKLLAERCYRDTLPTAKKSFEHALRMRDKLIETFPRRLSPAFRATVDADLLAEGLSKGDDAWPALEPILKSCLESTDLAVAKKIAGVYEKADPAVAQKMQVLLATKWKEVGNAKSTRDEKAQALQASLVSAERSAKISPQVRMAQLQKLTNDALSSVKADQKKESVLLRDTVRLAHASTMACALFNKEAGVERVVRFDELVKQVPDVDQTEEKKEPDKATNPKPAVAKGKTVDGKIIQDSLTTKSDPDPLQAGFVCKERVYALKAGQSYTLSLHSAAFNAHLRVEHPAGTSSGEADDEGILGFVVRLQFTAPEDGDYPIVVSAPTPGKLGKYEFRLEKGFGLGGGPLFGPRIFGPRIIPVEPQPAPKVIDKKDKQLNAGDLAKLDGKISTDRIDAFENLTDSVLGDLTPPQAQKIAKYLLVIDQTEDELERVKSKLEALGECRPLVLALADLVGDEKSTPIAEKRAEAIVGGVLARPLEFAGDKEWRTACRAALLQRALDLTTSVMAGADQAADILCALYKEQGRALGIEAPEFSELTRPTQALEGVIEHVAAKAAQQNPAAEDREYLGQVGRYVQAARFLAENDENDLEHMVLLQRAWIKVLVIYLREKAPAQAKAMARIQQDLDDKDRRSSGMLDQLRAGEESALRIWALADNLK